MATHARPRTVEAGGPPVPQVSSARVPPARETRRKASGPGEFDYSRYRQTVNSFSEFRRYVDGYPEPRGLMLYIYRLLPRIDMGLIGVRESVQLKISTTADMTEQKITQKLGRGRFMLTLNDANREKGQKEVVKTWLEVSDPTMPDPIYDVRTLLLADPANLDEINRLIEKGVLIRDASGAPRLRTDRDNVAAPVDRGDELLSRDVMGQVMVKLITAGAQQPGEVINQAMGLAKLLIPQQAGGVTLEQIELMLDRRLAALQVNPADPITAWEKMNGFIEKVRGTAGAVVGTVPTDATLNGLSEVFRSAAVLIPEVVKGIEYIQQHRERLAQTINGRAGVHNSVVNGTSPNIGIDLDAAAAPPQMTMAEKIQEVCTLAFTQMNQGITGFDFAAYVCRWHPGGIDCFRFLLPYGTVGTMGLLTTNPDAAKLLAAPATRAKIEIFLNDFFDYDPDPDPVPDEDDDPPLDAAVASGARRDSTRPV